MIATHPTCQFIRTHNPKGACTESVQVAFHVSTCRERHNASASLTVQLKQLCVPPQEKGCDRNTHVSRCDNVAVAHTARSIGKATIPIFSVQNTDAPVGGSDRRCGASTP